jgi:hypothetical protein
MIKDELNLMKTNAKKLPLDLKVLAVISFLAFVFTLLSHNLLPKTAYKAIIPITGWSPGYDYNFFFILILVLLVRPDYNKQVRMMRYFIIGLFLLVVVANTVEWFDIAPEEFTDPNPYLRYSKWQPLYAIVLPIVWIVINSVMLVVKEKGKD